MFFRRLVCFGKDGATIVNNEIWKDIPGYEGRYQASTLGRIKSLSRLINSRNQFGEFEYLSKEMILQAGVRGNYLMVVLYNPKHTFAVHHLIMAAFVGERDGLYVLHANGNPKDNRLENLRYDTQSENIYDVYRQGKAWKKLTVDDVEGIRFGLFCGFTCARVGELFGVGHQAISKIKNGDRYAWL
jgi:hypothetical protein